MTPGFAIELVRRAITLSLLAGGPLLLVALLIGVIVSLVQALTQIQEQTLSFIPKLLGVALVLILLLPWMLRELVEFVTETFRSLPMLVG